MTIRNHGSSRQLLNIERVQVKPSEHHTESNEEERVADHPACSQCHADSHTTKPNSEGTRACPSSIPRLRCATLPHRAERSADQGPAVAPTATAARSAIAPP